MIGSSTTARWSWHAALLAVAVLVAIVVVESAIANAQTPAPAGPKAPYEISPIGTDASRRVDRYQITLGPGASLWDLGFNRLPLVAIEQGDQKVVELIEQSFRAEYPDRGAQLVRPGDAFVLEVPTGTFVSKGINRQGDKVTFDSYAGDRLTTFPKDPVVQYRLQRANDPDHVEVLIQGGQTDAVAEAKKIYDVPNPDFIQVRTIRGALAERTSKLMLDANRKYLDEFRVFRDRATLVEDTTQGLKAYHFSRDDQDIPFVRVDDNVGDLTDPATFTRIFRIAYFRDGTIRKYVITESGDSTGVLARPESEMWRRTLPTWQEWLPGQAETLPPFAPAIASSGALQPGRILVLAFRPRVAVASPRPTGAAGSGSGMSCIGVPLGLVLLGGVLTTRTKKSARRSPDC